MQVLSRRNITTEPALSTVLNNITQECRRGYTSELLSILEDRDETERQEVERDLHSICDTSISLPGRQSGDKEWRKSRLEFVSDEKFSLSSSTCPVRMCVDEHVTKVNDAFLPLLSHFVEGKLSSSRAIEVLEIIKGVVIDLQKSPFRTRKASIDSLSRSYCGSSFCDGLLNALQLSKVETDGKVEICLAGNPVKTSLSLPVALDALEDTIHNLKNCVNLTKESLSLPLLKLNRIHSGSVLASGEELPFGIVSYVWLVYLITQIFIFSYKDYG